MLPFANILDHYINSCNLKRLLYPVGVTAKTSLPSERQFIVFSFSCCRSTRLFALMECFQKASRINPTLGFSDAMPCFSLIITAGFGHINRTCHFSPIRGLYSWANALYFENNAFRACSHFSYQASHQLASLADSSLGTLFINFAPAATYKNLLAGRIV